MNERLNIHLTKDVKMANKHKNRRSALLITNKNENYNELLQIPCKWLKLEKIGNTT